MEEISLESEILWDDLCDGEIIVLTQTFNNGLEDIDISMTRSCAIELAKLILERFGDA